MKTLVAQQEARAERACELDPQLLIDYNDRKREIETAQTSLGTYAASVQTMQEQMEGKKISWITRLEKVISKIDASFSRSFESIGCAGKVAVNREGDYSSWGIEIWVKFR